MDINRASNVSKITDELHDDIDELYESIVDEEGNEVTLIDSIIAKLKTLKTNLHKTDEV